MRDEHGTVDFVHFVCKYCKAPYENPIDFVKHKKEAHPIEMRPRLALLEKKTDDNNPGCSTSVSSESSSSQNVPQQLSRRLSHSSTSSRGSPEKPKTVVFRNAVSWKTGRYFYGCRLCTLKFKSYEEMAAHKSSKHPHLVPLMGEFDCPYCDSKYNCKKNFGSHVAKHRTAEQNGSHISCPQCTKKFLAQSAFQNHQLMFHSSGSSSKLQTSKVVASNCTKAKRVPPLRLNISKRPHATNSRPKVVLQLAPPSPLQTPTKQTVITPQSDSEDEYPTAEHHLGDNRTAQQHKSPQRQPAQPAQMVFSCSFCYKRFKSRDDRTEHEVHVHKILKKVRLAEDDDSSSTSSYAPPAPASSSTKYTCTFCNASFPTLPPLLHHVQSAHATPSKTSKPKGAVKEPQANPSIWTSMRQSPNKLANRDEHSAIPRSQAGTRSKLLLQKTISVAEVAQKVNNTRQGHVVAKGSAVLNIKLRSPSVIRARNQLKRKRTSSNTSRKCQYCTFKCRSASGMLYHQMRHHPGTRPHKCEHCNFSFIRESQLLLHLRIHTGETVHKCQFCDSRFTAHGILVRHMKKDHLAENLYLCQFCRTPHDTIDDWLAHIRSSHKVDEIEGTSMED